MANGGFFGGLAQGITAKRELGLRERALGLEEKSIENERQKFLLGETDKLISGTMDIIGKTITGVSDAASLDTGLDAYAEATASIESGGNYQAVGPEVTYDSGAKDHAYGKYQVMGANVGPWTREILGKSMTPQEFLANPAAQDAVYKGKFGQYIQETGSVEDAASKWFTGRTLAEGGATAIDVNGVSGAQYVQKFTGALAGLPRRKIEQGIAPLLKDVEELAAKSGRDPGVYRRQVEAMITSTPTGAAIAIKEGRAAALKRIAEVNTLVDAGVAKASALATAGVKTAAEAGTGLAPEKMLQVEGQLRDDYVNLAKPFIEIRDAFGRLESAAQNPTPAGDVSLVVAYMKLLDPGSIVHEGEFATAEQTTGVPARVRNLYNQLISGARLNEQQRNDFLDQGQKLFNVMEKQHGSLVTQFTGIASRSGVNPENVVVDLTRTATEAGGGGGGDIDSLIDKYAD